jgi:hypothetical protein
VVTAAAAVALDDFATLSTAANSEANKETKTNKGISLGISMREFVSHCGYLQDLAAEGTYYLNCKITSERAKAQIIIEPNISMMCLVCKNQM